MKKTKQQLLEDNWMLAYEFKNGIQIWCHKPRYEDIIQYVYWNPKTEEDMGLQTISYSNLRMMNGIYKCFENIEL